MNNWYAQKLLADDHAAERRMEADRHRQVRAEARRALRATNRSVTVRSAPARPSRRQAAVAVFARRRPAVGRAPAPVGVPVRSGHATAAS